MKSVEEAKQALRELDARTAPRRPLPSALLIGAALAGVAAMAVTRRSGKPGSRGVLAEIIGPLTRAGVGLAPLIVRELLSATPRVPRAARTAHDPSNGAGEEQPAL